MATSSINAGKTLCELSGWRISNLRLQKLLYIAHMYHLGRTDKNLVNENFEAWQHGPVEPNLYHYVKGYGADSIGNVFPRNGGVKKDDHEFDVLNETIDAAEKISDAALVSFTHWEKGAWYRVYERRRRGIIIPRDFIKEEYKARVERRKHNDQN